MSKKGNKKDKHDINTIALVTALINLVIALIELIKKKKVRERNLPYEKNTFQLAHCQDIIFPKQV